MELEAPRTSETGEQELDLRQLLGRLCRGRWLIVFSFAIFTTLFASIAFIMTPIYRASVVLVPSDPDQSGSLAGALDSLDGLSALAGVIGPIRNVKTEEALAVMRSRAFTEQFIIEHELMPELYARLWDPGSKSWSNGPERQPTLARAFERFNELRMIIRDPLTGLIRVQIEWGDPARAAFLANELVARLNAVMRARAIEETDAYMGFLRKELDVTASVEARNAIGRLMEAQINQRMLANVTRDYAFRVVDTALPPDRRDVVRPRKLLLITAGAAVGLIVGAVAVLLSSALGLSPKEHGNS